jgi:hypothetical protein
MSVPRVSTAYSATVNFRQGDWRVSAGDALATTYSDVATATSAARNLTVGVAVGATGVFERNGRFELRPLTSEWFAATRPGQLDPAQPYTHLEELVELTGNTRRLREMRIGSDSTGASFATDPSLRAIVDGPALLDVR